MRAHKETCHWNPEPPLSIFSYSSTSRQDFPGLITEDGQVTDEQTADFLRNYMNELHAFIVRVLTVLPRLT